MIAFISFFTVPAQAYDWAVAAKVTRIEVTYAPGLIRFEIDQAAGSCPAGGWIEWHSQGTDSTLLAANGQAILATLLAAKSSGQTINVFGANAGCLAQYLHIM